MPSSTRSLLERLLPVLLAVLLAGAPLKAGAQTPEARTRAQAKFNEAQVAYHLGEFQKALAGYTEAYRLLPLPGFLFNMAQCHRQLGNAESAAFSYRRYLDLATKAQGRMPDNGPLTLELIAEMDARVREEKARRPAARETAPAKKPGTLVAQGTEAANRRVKRGDGPQVPTPVPPVAPASTVEQGGLHKQWWVWAGAGAVVLLATGGAVYAVTASQPRTTTLGTLR